MVRRYKDIQWKCFIDNNPKEKMCENIPIYKVSDFLQKYNNEIIVIASRIYEKEMYSQLKDAGISDNYIINYGRLLDELNKDQYFDFSEIPFSSEEIFVDMGCWNGMTSVFLKQKIGDNLKKVIAFEPDRQRIQECKAKMKDVGVDFKIIEKGAWSESNTLHFYMEDTINMLKISENIGERMEVEALDNVLNEEKVTFIKMDIEGSEYEALRGCQKTIQKYKPILAISVYHKWDDIIKIPILIKSYCPEYKLYLRHYAPYESETVLYAIPKR